MEYKTTIWACQVICKQKVPLKVKISIEKKAGDLSTLEKKVPRHIGRMCVVSGRRRRLQALVFPMPLCPHTMGIPGYNVGRGYL